MIFEKTLFKDLIICTPEVYKDDRGYFYESFNAKKFESFAGFKPDFVQDNQSQSTYGVLRGLHFQVGKFAQSKLVRVVAGEVLDVVVDMRPDEPTYGTHFSIILSAENRKQLYVPKGMAHGFVTLSSQATFLYKCDAFYHKESERGLSYDDPFLAIDWKISPSEIHLSKKDKENESWEAVTKQLGV